MLERVLLFGSRGQIGLPLTELLDTSYSVVAVNSDNLNYHSKQELDLIYKFVRPHHVINCVAYTDVDGVETHFEERSNCYYLNFEFPLYLSELCQRYGSQFVHYSTDYVFDGTKAPYDERAIHSPLNYYGKTKSLFDLSVEYTKIKNFRVQCVYSNRNKNFYKTMKRLSEQKPSIDVIHDQITCPTHANWIAEMTFNVLGDPHYGLFNLNPDGNCSFAEFAEKIVGDRCIINRITTEQYALSKTKRPKNGILNNEKFKKTFGFTSLNSWQQVYEKYENDELQRIYNGDCGG